MKKVQLITHGDMDGRACAVIAHWFMNDVDLKVTYASYDNLDLRISDALNDERWDELWITDLGPSAKSIVSIERCVADGRIIKVCDHHKTSRAHDQMDFPWFYLDESLCGAQVFARALGMDYETPFLKVIQAWDIWLTHNPDGTPYAWRHAGEMLNRYCLWLGNDQFLSFCLRQELPGIKTMGPGEFLEACGEDAEKMMRLLQEKEENNVRRLAKRCTRRVDPDGNPYAFVVTIHNIGQLGEYLHQGLTRQELVKDEDAEYVETFWLDKDKIDPDLQHLDGCIYLLALNLEYGAASLRRIGNTDVSNMAKKHGGGGHAGAAGFQLKGSWQLWLADWFWTMVAANEKIPGYEEYRVYLED